MIGEMADRVGDVLRRRVHVSFVDVLGPTPGRGAGPMPETGRSSSRRFCPAAITSAPIYPRTSRPADTPTSR